MSRRLSRAEIERILEEDEEKLHAEILAHPERFNPEWLQAFYRAQQASQRFAQKLRERTGVTVNGINDIIKGKISREDYRRALPVILESLHDPEMEPIWDGLVAALRYKDAVGIAARPLIEIFRQMETPELPPEESFPVVETV